jgi:hypothetical protein
MVWAIPLTAKHARNMNRQEHLCTKLKSRIVDIWLSVCVCVCVCFFFVLVRTLGYFSYWPPNKNLMLLLLSFLPLYLFRFQHYFIFFCIYFFCFPHYYFLFLILICVVCDYVSLFLLCYVVFFFSYLHTCILSPLFEFMLVSVIICLFTYLHRETQQKMHPKIQLFTNFFR